MTHHVLAVQTADKPALVRELASGTGRSLLFMRTKHSAKKLAKQLTAAGIPAVDLHGNLSQNAREKNLASFTDGSTRVLVATDIAARGIHVDEVELVVHVDPPTEHKAYLHRSGRTARAGAAGVVVTLMTPDQKRDVADLVRLAKINPTTTAVHPGHQTVQTLVGEKAAFVEPVAVPAAAQQQRGAAAVAAGTVAALVAVVVAAPAVSSPRRGARRRARRSRPVRCSARRRSRGSPGRRRSPAGASARPPTSRPAVSADRLSLTALADLLGEPRSVGEAAVQVAQPGERLTQLLGVGGPVRTGVRLDGFLHEAHGAVDRP